MYNSIFTDQKRGNYAIFDIHDEDIRCDANKRFGPNQHEEQNVRPSVLHAL